MQYPELVQLIEAASQICGGQSLLAARIGASANRITDWKTGVRNCPPEKVALIASEANLQADQWLVRATVWKHEGTEEGERLQRALKKQCRATGGALPTGAVEAPHIPRCVLSKAIGRGKGIAIKLRLHREALRA